jgi:adenylate cyclase
MFIWFFSKSISIPLKVLAAAAHTIESGEFDIQLYPERRRDEIGLLTDSFQKMCSAAIQAIHGQIKPGGLPKHATIFFSDIRGFTSKCETFTNTFSIDAPDRIVHWLNTYLTSMVECVEQTGGIIDKFIGDAVMAHWGTAHTTGNLANDAFNCVKAALKMRKALFLMNKQRRHGDTGNPIINIGCGINTGVVTAGQLGSDLRMEYTVIGDPVNLASRIEGLNKTLGTDILISENTWNHVKNHFITEEMPPISVAGKEKPVRVFAVINFAKAKKGPKTLAEVRSLLGIKLRDKVGLLRTAEEKKEKE